MAWLRRHKNNAKEYTMPWLLKEFHGSPSNQSGCQKKALHCSYHRAPLALEGPPLPDLAVGRPRGKAFQSLPQQWVAFSDLHVSTSTLAVCCDVLRRVHDEALARRAGILFLGMRADGACAAILCYVGFYIQAQANCITGGAHQQLYDMVLLKWVTGGIVSYWTAFHGT